MIGKSRHLNAAERLSREPVSATAFGQGCGVLRHSPAPGTYAHTRYAPSAELANWVQHFWIERWNLSGFAPQTREVLPHPCVHLVFARHRSRIFGVQLGRFVRQLSSEDCILGVKFHPGAFYPFLREPVSALANTSIPMLQLFCDAAEWEDKVLAQRDERAMVESASAFLIARLPPLDPQIKNARRAVKEIANTLAVTRVEHLHDRLDVQERALQRLFHRYVGASARWVIKRYRVYEALERLAIGKPLDWVALAQDLGYYDQAHFINDFKKLVGRSPTAYVQTHETSMK